MRGRTAADGRRTVRADAAVRSGGGRRRPGGPRTVPVVRCGRTWVLARPPGAARPPPRSVVVVLLVAASAWHRQGWPAHDGWIRAVVLFVSDRLGRRQIRDHPKHPPNRGDPILYQVRSGLQGIVTERRKESPVIHSGACMCTVYCVVQTTDRGATV